MRRLCWALLLILPACGPLIGPMVPRLDPEQQKTADAWWQNILARQSGIDHQGMLDVVIMYHLFEYGVDRATFHAEKTVDDRLVIMDVLFDRLRPQRDSFTLTLFDKQGALIRRETYTRAEVDRTYCDYRHLATITSATQPATGPAPPEETPDQLLERKRLEARAAAVQAATQPLPKEP